VKRNNEKKIINVKAIMNNNENNDIIMAIQWKLMPMKIMKMA
jgi:hypothetical protein